MYLRSGDIIVMSGKSRRFYHGVPRIMADFPHFLNEAAKDPMDKDIIHYLKNVRINVNVRQVWQSP